MTKKDSKILIAAAESEGLEYAAINGYLDEIKDKEFKNVLEAFKAAQDKLESFLDAAEADLEV